MNATSRGLGRGLDALFRDNENTPGQPQRQSDVSIVPLDALVPNPMQPRKNFAPEALEELAVSIRSQGIVQPLLVRPVDNDRYEIVAGERRWRAAKLADLTEVPVLVRQLSDMEVMAAALIENLQREDLNPLEEARALSTLREQFGLSQDALANTLGKSRPAIANALRLLNLNSEAQEALENGHISAGHARAVLSLGSLDAQSELVRHCIQDRLSVRDAEEAARLWKEEGIFPWLQIEEEDHPAASEEEQQAVMQTTALARQAPQRKMKSPFLRNMQKQLRQELKIRANISGTETRGRISLGYQNQEEFHVLLRRLGIDTLDPAGE
jgi:ParB family chromosome partitioning protein